MKCEWLTPKEITTLPGMPGTIQGVHKKAKREGWQSRRKAGVQGPAVEFCMPEDNHSEEVGENRALYQSGPSSGEHDLQTVWLTVFNQLSEKSRALLIANIIKYGVNNLIRHEATTHAEKIAALIESLPQSDQELIIELIKTKQLALLMTAPILASSDITSE